MLTPSRATKPRISLERDFEASPADVWELWTTREGIESWWGPDGFVVHVHELDLRPGGLLLYSMTAVAQEQINYLRAANMPLVMESRITFVEVRPPERLVYNHLADFIPGVEPYDVQTTVELTATPSGVRLVLTIDRMHEESWTKLAVSGWESELGKLERKLRSLRETR